jgi:hypothetical protein
VLLGIPSSFAAFDACPSFCTNTFNASINNASDVGGVGMGLPSKLCKPMRLHLQKERQSACVRYAYHAWGCLLRVFD